MIELRCERRVHGEVDARQVEWKYCRECSKALSTPQVKRRVFHRWDMKKSPPVRLKDVTYNDRVLVAEDD